MRLNLSTNVYKNDATIRKRQLLIIEIIFYIVNQMLSN
jgi:hypothetical protein